MSDTLQRLHARAVGSVLLLRTRRQYRFSPDVDAFSPPVAPVAPVTGVAERAETAPPTRRVSAPRQADRPLTDSPQTPATVGPADAAQAERAEPPRAMPPTADARPAEVPPVPRSARSRARQAATGAQRLERAQPVSATPDPAPAIAPVPAPSSTRRGRLSRPGPVAPPTGATAFQVGPSSKATEVPAARLVSVQPGQPPFSPPPAQVAPEAPLSPSRIVKGQKGRRAGPSAIATSPPVTTQLVAATPGERTAPLSAARQPDPTSTDRAAPRRETAPPRLLDPARPETAPVPVAPLETAEPTPSRSARRATESGATRAAEPALEGEVASQARRISRTAPPRLLDARAGDAAPLADARTAPRVTGKTLAAGADAKATREARPAPRATLPRLLNKPEGGKVMPETLSSPARLERSTSPSRAPRPSPTSGRAAAKAVPAPSAKQAPSARATPAPPSAKPRAPAPARLVQAKPEAATPAPRRAQALADSASPRHPAPAALVDRPSSRADAPSRDPVTREARPLPARPDRPRPPAAEPAAARPAPGSRARSREADAHDAAPEAARPSPPEVRVEIGRIDVTLPSPPRAVVRQRAQPPPMSLKPRRAHEP